MKTITYTVDNDPISELEKGSVQAIAYVREAIPPAQFSTPTIISTMLTYTQDNSDSPALTAGQKPKI